MKLAIAGAALAAGAHAAATSGFCDDKLAGNYQHDTEALDSGYYYTCNTDESSDPTEQQCATAANFDADYNIVMEQLVYNPNNGNADCTIVSPGGFCDFPANVDFSAGNGVDASIDCTADEGSGDAATTVVATTSAAATTNGDSMPAGYNASFCAGQAGGNHIFAESCGEGYYYQCANNYTYLMQCPTGTVMNPALGTCDWSYDVADCAAAPDNGSGDSTDDTSDDTADDTSDDTADDTSDDTAEEETEEETTEEEPVCDFDWSSPTMGVCTTNNWCSGKVSGYHVPDDTAACESGAYYMCNWGNFQELACAAGQRWYVPSPLPEWAGPWYGYCDTADNVSC